jgi:hypothetical protein
MLALILLPVLYIVAETIAWIAAMTQVGFIDDPHTIAFSIVVAAVGAPILVGVLGGELFIKVRRMVNARRSHPSTIKPSHPSWAVSAFRAWVEKTCARVKFVNSATHKKE